MRSGYEEFTEAMATQSVEVLQQFANEVLFEVEWVSGLSGGQPAVKSKGLLGGCEKKALIVLNTKSVESYMQTQLKTYYYES